MRKYEVKEVCRYTGLTRKDLFLFEESIPPIDVKNSAGYKLYDVKGFEKLCYAALFRKLGAEPKFINSRFSEEVFNKDQIFDELIEKATAMRQKADDIITVANVFRQLDWEMLLVNPLEMADLHRTATKIRNVEQDDTFKSLMKGMDEKAEKRLISILRGFGKYINDEPDDPKVICQVEKIIGFAKTTFDINPMFFITLISSALISVGEFRNEVETKTKGDLSIFIVEAIVLYQYKNFFLDGAGIIKEFDNCLGRDFSDDNVKLQVERFMLLYEKWFGSTNYDDALAIMKSTTVSVDIRKDMTYEAKLMNYITAALDYYANHQVY